MGKAQQVSEKRKEGSMYGKTCSECGQYTRVPKSLMGGFAWLDYLQGRWGDPFVCPDCVESIYGWEVRKEAMRDSCIIGDWASLEAAARAYAELIDEAKARWPRPNELPPEAKPTKVTFH